MASPTAKATAGLAHSLEKFFTDSPVPRRTKLSLSGLRGETLSFQVAYRSDRLGEVTLRVGGPLAEHTVARRIDLAHVEHPTYREKPENLIGRAPGFFPDPLVPEVPFRTYPNQTRGIWFTLHIPDRAAAGRSRLSVRVASAGRSAADLSVDVEVIGAALPKQELKNVHWFHNDCLQSYYRFEAWSPEHWRIVEKYLRNAADHGVNTITTPVFTPPLDTAVGTERPTMQLVDVQVAGKDRYRFGFRKFDRWVDLCRKCGMTDFEISHLSTQWGAKFAPKVVAEVRGRVKRIFGWETPSDGPEYRAFLLQFLPELVKALRRKRALGRAFLHVSDEPSVEQLPQYKAVRETLRRGAPELPVLEALSNIEFHREGCVDRPCPATNHAQPFLDAKVPHLWTYYCCGQAIGVSNRFMDFPSARNRILGWQLFKFGFEGFLHWGYNHWYEGAGSVLLDPYTASHGGRPLPPGDGFVVYPGKDGPVDSIRWEVFREGLQDLRALCLLRDLAREIPSRNAARLLALEPVKDMFTWPRSPDWILGRREAVNRTIAKLV